MAKKGGKREKGRAEEGKKGIEPTKSIRIRVHAGWGEGKRG
jgi:hypothetical protein